MEAPKYERAYQKILGIEPPDRVLWAALKAHLPAEDVRKVEAAHERQKRRYARACKLNQIARWVQRVERYSRPLDERTAQKLAERRAILADPQKFVEEER